MADSDLTWAMLEGEHARMRRFVLLMQQLTRAGDWRRSEEGRDALAAVVEALDMFDRGVHRPKGVALWAALDCRVAGEDRLLVDELESEQRRCEDMLRQMRDLLSEAPLDEAGEVVCADLLLRHNRMRLDHLAREDTTLRACAERTLTPDDWAIVAASITAFKPAD